MARIESGAVERLHYALTDSQCNSCGAQLEWNPVFDNVNLPKYTAKHCGKFYTINIETVKFDVIAETEIEKEDGIQEKILEENKEPRAILMAQGKKKDQMQEKAIQKEKQ